MSASGGSLFDIVGPIMVGPSSSHTAGAVRLAQMARCVAGKPIHKAELKLYNSFAQTYRGHGTDKGLVAGLLGYAVDDERIRMALEDLERSEIQVTITPVFEKNAYSPNTVVFHLVCEDGEQLTVVGHSIGGGKVYVSKINDFNVSLKGELPTLLMWYKDKPGMIWQVTKIIAEQGINIATLNCTRRHRGSEAFMVIALDSLLPEACVQTIRDITEVYVVRNIDKLPE
jgi:L-serine dehydratase